jgi:hypothetical protein
MMTKKNISLFSSSSCQSDLSLVTPDSLDLSHIQDRSRSWLICHPTCVSLTHEKTQKGIERITGSLPRDLVILLMNQVTVEETIADG